MDGSDGDLVPRDREQAVLPKVFAPPTMPLRVARFGCHLIEPEWHNQRLIHGDWGLYLADRRGLRVRHAGGTHHYRADRVTLLPPWLPYTYVTRPQVGHCYLHFSLPHLSRAVVTSVVPRPRYLGDRVLRDELWATARGLADGPQVVHAWRMQALAERAWLALLDELPAPSRRRLIEAFAPRRLHPALDHIDRHLDRPIGVPELAAVLGVGREHTIRLFRRHLGQSPGAYIIERRVLRAAEELLVAEDSVRAIAQRCGFPTPQYLARRFKRLLGTTPTDYRRMHQDLGDQGLAIRARR